MRPDPTVRFTDRVADYTAARPRYPDALVRLLADELGLAAAAVVADIGAGTGLSAEPFLRHGYRVLAVEPNAAMRAAAEALLAGHAGFRAVAGTAEATRLAAASVDLVLVAQAFHWFDAAAARSEFLRILRPPARVCLAWNTRRPTGSRFLDGYEALLRRYGTDYDEVRRRTEATTRVDRLAAFFGRPFEHRVLPNAQVLDLEQLRRRVRSASYVPAEGAPGHAPMMAALASLFEAASVDGRVRIDYDLDVFFGTLAAG